MRIDNPTGATAGRKLSDKQDHGVGIEREQGGDDDSGEDWETESEGGKDEDHDAGMMDIDEVQREQQRQVRFGPVKKA